ADEAAQLLVSLQRRAAEADEQQLGDRERRRRSSRRGEGGAGPGQRGGESEQDGWRKADAHQLRAPRAASTRRRTRRGSTGLPSTPSRLTPVPTMRPSATDRRSAAVSAVAPLPTRSGVSGTAPRTRLRSPIGVGSPVAVPDTT